MTPRYHPQDDDERLDEYLCEYVDGTMEPSVRRAFEEYLSQNPELSEHVRRLSMARSLLCSSRQCAHASTSLQHRLHIEIARDQMGADPAPAAVSGLGRFATVTSFVGFAVLLGAIVGTSLVESRRPGSGVAPVSAASADRSSVPSDAHAAAPRAPRIPLSMASFGMIGPATAMPLFDLTSPVPGVLLSDSGSVALRRTRAVP